MSVGPELSIMYHHNSQQYYNSTPLIIAQHQQYRIQQEQSQQYHQQGSPFYDQMINDQHNKQQQQQSKQNKQQYSFSPPLSVASSSSTSSGSFHSNLSSSPPPANNAFQIHATTPSNVVTQMRIKKKLPATFNASQTTSNATHQQSLSIKTSTASWNFTWLVFMNEKWVPFDILNQTKLEQTLTVGGTFVDISDSHFPDVKRVRVFPKSNYLSYLGVKYRLSRIMQPDAYLDHVGVAEAKKPSSLPLLPTPSSLPTPDEGGDSRTQRAWEM
ncbi:unnamed protein product [Mucor fragilis]